MEITKEFAMWYAANNGYADLSWEVESLMELGYEPWEALREFDILPTEEELREYYNNSIKLY